MEGITMFYACLRVKRSPKDQNGPQKIIKKEFVDRNEARAYISAIQNDEKQSVLYDQFWTE
jgi:hypothetical protein